MDQYKKEDENEAKSSSAPELDAFMREFKHFRQFRDLKDLRKKFNDFIEVQNVDESNQQVLVNLLSTLRYDLNQENAIVN